MTKRSAAGLLVGKATLSPLRRISVALTTILISACSGLGIGVGPCAPAAKAPPPKMDSSGVGSTELPAAATARRRSIVLAAGCFWCVESVFSHVKGVTDVVSGYAGGRKEDANYHQVSGGQTDHAESVRILYDPTQITLGELLQIFFSTHDPTTKDRQGPDRGHQYRSAIFYATDEERAVAEAYIRELDASGHFDRPIVTTLEKLDVFFDAEPYHQDFVELHPDHGYVVQWALPKLKKLEHLFPQRFRAKTKPE
ncbi:MAG: peptide-methionine (S)-S-oxide reductase MsrA [Deltaproteobacteria bacterium]|nr:peptide-methionine (S)-S-oxide reductase MsrA [Deltaproteobacteria bacterium]